MNAISLLICLLLITSPVTAQSTYQDSIKNFIATYIRKHEVIQSPEGKSRIRFFPVDLQYRVLAAYESLPGSPWFALPTSSGRSKLYRKAGKLSFNLQGRNLTAFVYQSQALLQDPRYASYLLLLFTDSTTGNATYEGGRYIDLEQADIREGKISIDFNKAYNPYCAYGTKGKFSCPIPPAENDLPIAIKAGEKKFQERTEKNESP